MNLLSGLGLAYVGAAACLRAQGFYLSIPKELEPENSDYRTVRSLRLARMRLVISTNVINAVVRADRHARITGTPRQVVRFLLVQAHHMLHASVRFSSAPERLALQVSVVSCRNELGSCIRLESSEPDQRPGSLSA